MSKTILAQASLTLYAYHLRTDISKGPEQPSEKAAQLWEQLVELGQTLEIPALQNLKHKLICYGSNDQYDPIVENQLTLKWQSLLHSKKDPLNFELIASTAEKDLRLNGVLCPFRLHDTYAIDLTLSSDDTIFIDELEQLNPKGLLLPQYIQASIGQTLLLYGKFIAPCGDHEKLQELADYCVAQILRNQTLPPITRKGKLLNNQIFEYETLEIEPSKRYHILVWFINPDTSIDNELKDVSELLLYLLCARHKILSAYDQCQRCVHQAEKVYSELEKYIEKFEAIALKDQFHRLEEFKHLLVKLPTTAIDYSKYLRNLADDEITIATNIKNYKSNLNKLSELPGNDLSFLKEFIELTHKKYEAQIQVDRLHLEPGAKLFQQLIDTVRGIVAIDRAELEAQKAERDRANEAEAEKREKAAQEREKQLEQVITLVGAGLAVSSISSSVMNNPSEQFQWVSKDNFSSNLVYIFLLNVGFHVLVGVMSAIFLSFVLFGMRQLLKAAGKLK
jgi:hypothetical protein